jgi:hypothetical protein
MRGVMFVLEEVFCIRRRAWPGTVLVPIASWPVYP